MLLWVWVMIAWYVFFTADRWTPKNNSLYDTWTSTGYIPSVWEYLFDSWWEIIYTWASITGSSITGDQSWWQLVFPTGYVEQYNKGLLILQNDSLVNTYIDTDNLSMSWFSSISINPLPSWVTQPSFTLQWTIDPTVEKLFILWVYKDGAFLFETISFNSSFWSFAIDSKKGTIKPWNNTYYLIGKKNDGSYALQHIWVQTVDGSAFYNTLDKICILDVCSDPTRAKIIQTWSNSIIQKSSDGKQVIEIQPDSSITIANKCDDWTIGIKQIKKRVDSYHLSERWCNYREVGITQSFMDLQGNPLANNRVNGYAPSKITYGWLSYVNPVYQHKNKQWEFQVTNKIDATTIGNTIIQQWYTSKELLFELPNYLFVSYSLDLSQLKVITPSNKDGSYKIIPKVAQWMKNPLVYTVASDDRGTHDTITSYFQWTVIENVPNCTNPKNNSDPQAKFGILPINDQYDIVGFWNCYQSK